MISFQLRLSNLIAVLLLFTVLCAAQDDPDTITVESQLVVINATITTADGKPATGLKRGQFQVFEDGKEQRLEFFLTEKTPFAAVILLDTSGSMEQRVSLARSAAIQFLDGLRADDVAAIYNFDSKVSPVQEFSGSRDLAEGFFDLKADGMTILNDAIVRAAVELEKRSEKRRAIIVLSDGADTRSSASADKALKAALAANATIYTVDMSSADSSVRERFQNQGALKNFADKSGGKFIATPGGGALRDAFRTIVQELGIQYTLGYQPANTAKDGKYRTIELRVTDPALTVRTRKGYNAPKAGK
ncbi:MAG: VWA domain-containing protein [Acidobacteria bacterium]|nr:VWA domain-containing protein [Acidobacteriota bacterium]